MKLLRMGQGIDLVWTRDPDVELPDAERLEDATDEDGKPSLEGRMVPASTVTLRPGAVVWTVRPMSVQEYAALSADTKNVELVKLCVVSAHEIGGETYTGDALREILDANGLALIGDLAHAVWGVTADTRFLIGAGASPRLA